LGELPDRKLHRAQQRDDAQAGRIGKRTEGLGSVEHRLKDIKISLYAGNSERARFFLTRRASAPAHHVSCGNNGMRQIDY
jgi:hypothetical protein